MRFVLTLMQRYYYSATSHNIKLVHWPLMGGLLHLVQGGGDCAALQPAQASPCCTKIVNPSRPVYQSSVLLFRPLTVRCSAVLNVPVKGLTHTVISNAGRIVIHFLSLLLLV